MKHFASLCALLLAGSMPGFASTAHSTGVNYQNQFHFQPVGRRAAQAERTTAASSAHNLNTQRARGPKGAAQPIRSRSASTKIVRRHTPNPPTGKLGYVSAFDIPAGGASWWNALPGDFNGDGKTDIVGEVATYNGSSYVYSESVVLSNGNGTFQTAALTAINNNDECSKILVGDVNGDGKSDLIVGHQPGACGNSYSVPTFDVLLSNGDGTFTASANVNNTVQTSGISGGTLADVNGDGKLDLILVDQGNPASVWTLLGNGDGTFEAPTSVALSGETGNNVVIADVNGDGILDIVDNDYSSNQVTVYLATSATTYGPAAAYTTPDGNYDACSLAVGDLNGDGKPEIVNSNCSEAGNDITIYVNNGDGTYATGVYYDAAMSGGTNSGAASVYTEAVSIADVNGDGKADILASNDDSGDITVLLGNGDGTVNVPTVGYAAGGYPYTPAIVADFNGDGFPDLVIADDAFSFAYLQGYGDGTFRSAHDYYGATTSYAYGYNVATGDFNGDGYPDFVIADTCWNCTTPLGITVFLSNPDGSLQPGMNFGTNATFNNVAVADFNGNGKLDIAATDESAGTVTIFTGDGTGNFTMGSSFNTDLASNAPYGVFVGDFNKDGFPDLAIANWNGSDIAILLNDGAGNFPTPVPYALSGPVWQGVGVADVNADGNLDLVLPLADGSAIAVLEGNGDGTFQPEQDYSIGANYPEAVTLADLNGDGIMDVAVTLDQGNGQDIGIAFGSGQGNSFAFGTFTLVPSSLQNYNIDSPYPQYIQAVDVDGDGKPDLVYANAEYGTVGILFGEGGGTFYDPVEYPVGEFPWGLVVADVNQDGAPDVVTTSDDFGGVTVALNANGSGTLGNYTITSSVNSATVNAGGSATFTFTVTPTNHYNGTVTFTCPSGLPNLATCSFNPSSVTLDGLSPVTVQVTISTTAPSASVKKPAASNSHGSTHPKNISMLYMSLNGMGVLGMMLAGSFKKRNRWNALGLVALAACFLLVGCGGSSSTPTPTKASSTSSVSSSSPTALVGQAITFTGTVSASSGTPTGTVTYMDGTTTLGTGTLSNGTSSFQTSSLAAGVHNITIAYGGDANFNPSTSTALSQTVDNIGSKEGNYTVTVTATGTAGTNGVKTANQSVNLTVTVQ